ncbi:MAG: 50S ribosomal protein L18 [Candidatus Riflebacteria bacterium]|nr:50S ribosomal protein L18 [Candidatus Riflebacteria bacterium]
MSISNVKSKQRVKRHDRSRFYLSGSTERPRLAVYRSHNHIYAQIIDDDKGVTLVAASSNEKEMREAKVDGGNKGGAKIVGTAVAKRALAKGISLVVFDRGGFRYHGRIKELADGAREGGLKF